MRDVSFFFFFNDTATTEIYTLSLHDALPIWEVQFQPRGVPYREAFPVVVEIREDLDVGAPRGDHPLPLLEFADRKSTRLNSSHANISYAVFCLKKKKKSIQICTLSCRT